MRKILFIFVILIFGVLNAQTPSVNFHVHDLDKSEGVNFSKIHYGSEVNYMIGDGWKLYRTDRNLRKTVPYGGYDSYEYIENIINVDSQAYRYDNNYFNLLKVTNTGVDESIETGRSLKVLGDYNNQKFISYFKNDRLWFARLDAEGMHPIANYSEDYLSYNELHDHYFILLYANKIVVYNLLDNTTFTHSFVSTYVSEGMSTHKIAYFNQKIYFSTVDVEYSRIGLKSNILDLRTGEISINTRFPLLDSKIINVNGKGIFKLDVNSDKIYIINPDESFQEVNLPLAISEEEFYENHYIDGDRLIIKFLDSKHLEINVREYTANLHDRLNGISTSIAISGDEIYYIRDQKLNIYNLVSRVNTLYNEDLLVKKVFVKNGNEIFINASLPATGYEMYSVDVDTKDLIFYGDANNDPNSYPNNFYDINGKTIVLGIKKAFVTEGTPQSTYMLNENFEVQSPFIDYQLSANALKVNDKVVYICNDEGAYNAVRKLCSIDGNNFQINKISNHTNNNVDVLGFLAAGETKVYFIGKTLQHGKELWVSDGTLDGTRMVKDLTLGANSTEIETLYSEETIVGDKFYFIKIYRIGDNSRKELWVSDGTSQGTYKLKDITLLTAPNTYSTAYLVSAKGNNLLFTRRDLNIQGSNLGLYQLNLETLAETKLSNLKDDYGFRDIVVQGDNVYFTEKISIFNSGFSRINVRTLEKRIYESSFYVTDDTKTIRDCQDYMLYDDGAFDSQLFVFNNRTNRKVQLPYTYDPYTLSSMCINGRLVLSGNTDAMDSHFVTITDDSFNFHPVTLNGNRYSNRVSLMYYNELTNKMYSRSENEIVEAAGELLISDFYLEPFTLSLANLDDPNKNSLLSIYPNPTSRELFISPKDVTILDYSIYDLTGREIKSLSNQSNEKIKIDVSDFLKGVYIINVNTSKGKEAKKLIIQ